MRCRYCNQKLNLFKSLAGSSFCSQDHQKLYEAAQANNAFERLLQYVENDPQPPRPAKPSAAPSPKPDQQETRPAPPVTPEPHTIPVARAASPAPDPPMTGFLFKLPVASASSQAKGIFEVLEPGFPPEATALPAFNWQRPDEPESRTPPPFASWSHVSLSEADTAKPLSEVSSIDSVRPRSIALAVPPVDSYPLAAGIPSFTSWSNVCLAGIDTAKTKVASVDSVRPRTVAPAMPSTENRALAPAILSSALWSNASGFHLAIQAVIDTREFSNLTRLSPLQSESPSTNEIVQCLPAKSCVPVLSQPDVQDLSGPLTKAGPENTLGMSGAMTRSIGREVAAPAARPSRLFATPGACRVSRPILATVQGASGAGRPAILPSRLYEESSAPAMHWPAIAPSVSGLTSAAFVNLRLDPGGRPAALGMNGAVTRFVAARAVRRPQTQSSLSVNTPGTIDALNPVSANAQNSPYHPDFLVSSARQGRRDCVVPAVPSSMLDSVGMSPVVAPRALSIRESDAPAGVGIPGAMKPAATSGRFSLPATPASPGTVQLGINREARKVAAGIQSRDVVEIDGMSPARPVQHECLLPGILWFTPTSLKSAIASLGWFRETDCAGLPIEPGPPSSRLIALRFAPESSKLGLPALARDGAACPVTLEVREWMSEMAKKESDARRLARKKPSPISPLSLVARPHPATTRLAARQIGNLRQFTSIVHTASLGIAPAAQSASIEENKPAMKLPHFGLDRSQVLRISSPATRKTPPLEAVSQQREGSETSPQPSPVRTQPASMLVLARTHTPSFSIQWGPSSRWATIISPSVPTGDEVQLSSSEEGTLSSLQLLADALRVDPEVTGELAAAGLKSRRPAISLAFGEQTTPPRVVAGNALPRRTGPKLPVVTGQLDDLIVTSR